MKRHQQKLEELAEQYDLSQEEEEDYADETPDTLPTGPLTTSVQTSTEGPDHL